MIYFAQAVAGGPIKIGTSGDVGARLAQLEAHYGRSLALLGTAPGGPAEERAWHRRFAHLRLGRTEQFRPAPELMEAIGRPLLVGANPDAAEAMPATGSAKGSVLSLKGSEPWKAWLDGFAARKGMPSTVLIVHALHELAKREGYLDPPRRV